MEKQKVIEYYGTVAQVADILGLTRQAVYTWPDPIPEKNAARLERITKGALIYDWQTYQ